MGAAGRRRVTRPADLWKLARGRAATDLAVTAGGRWTAMLLGLAGSVLSARALGPGDFGRFGLVIATVTICGTLADAGLAYTAVKFIAQYSSEQPERARAVARAFLWLRLGGGAAGGLLGLLFSAPLAGLLGYSELTPYLQLAFCTLFSLGVSSYPDAVLVGLGLFGRLGAAGVLNALITLAGIAALALAGRLTLTTLIAWNVVLPMVSTLPAWRLLPGEWRPWRLRPAGDAPQPGVVREILGFSRWMIVSNLGSVVSSRLELLLLGRLAGPSAAGVYSVALTLAMRLDTLDQSLIVVMLPRANRLVGRASIRRYARRVLAGSIGLALLVGAAAVAIYLSISLLYGARYGASAGIFLALTPSVLFDLATSALFLPAFALNRPRVLAAADWLRVAVLGGAGALLIPGFGGYGAAAARLLSRAAGGVYTLRALYANQLDQQVVADGPGGPGGGEAPVESGEAAEKARSAGDQAVEVERRQQPG